MDIDLRLEHPVPLSARVRQFLAMFDVPLQQKTTLHLQGRFDLEARPWNVGLIVGPSGCGKSTIMRHVWGDPPPLTWSDQAVVDDFAPHLSVHEIAEVCQAVGFNTIPAWLRPYKLLSNGEKFRVEIARRLIETPADQPIVIDEFTSVVDRQVARIASWAVQKWVRRAGRRFVAVTCHYDLVDWLQPDWIFEPALMALSTGENGEPARPASHRRADRSHRGRYRKSV